VGGLWLNGPMGLGFRVKRLLTSLEVKILLGGWIVAKWSYGFRVKRLLTSLEVKILLGGWIVAIDPTPHGGNLP